MSDFLRGHAQWMTLAVIAILGLAVHFGHYDAKFTYLEREVVIVHREFDEYKDASKLAIDEVKASSARDIDTNEDAISALEREIIERLARIEAKLDDGSP